MKSICFPVIALMLLAGCGLSPSSGGMKKYRLNAGVVCISSDIPASESKTAGILGAGLGANRSGIFVGLPWPPEGEASLMEQLVVFVTTAGYIGYGVPEVSRDQLEDVPDAAGLFLMSASENDREYEVFAHQPDSRIGHFYAYCRKEAALQMCSRPFVHAGVEGRYMFFFDELKNWRLMEKAVSDALRSGRIAAC